MKKRISSIVFISNFILLIVFLIPAFKLDLFNENYSTLSLTTKGYLYVLLLGIIIGFILAYETYYISGKKYSLIIFLSLLIGTIIPHHVPYNLQGNLHLLCAYIGYFMLVIMTLHNCKLSITRNLYILMLFISVLLYLYCGMVNTISEIIVMVSTLLINMYNYLRITK